MDPIGAAVLGMILWFMAATAGFVMLYLTCAYLGSTVGGTKPFLGGAILGWFLGTAWWIFGVMQAIVQLVHLIQLIN